MTSLHAQRAFDYALVGGGLQNGLIAMALAEQQPHARIALIERDPALGGNHTWCFHSDDVDPAARAFVDPLVVHRWPGYEVRFPGLTRGLDAPYAAVTSASLDAAVSAVLGRPGCAVITGRTATAVTRTEVALDSGAHICARLVIDARGPTQGMPTSDTGYQKFVGHEVVLDAPHGLARPVLMDATVPQTRDGYRFFYTLPLAADRLLIEETLFSDTAALDTAALRTSLADYMRARGYRVQRVAREETGVLPIPWRDHGVGRQPDGGPLVAGYQGGWFHPATGYSFPIAVRLADHVSRTPIADVFGPALTALIAHQRSQAAYCYRLNKMLFAWFQPHLRYHVFERFYRLPEPTIRRFYALALTGWDRKRILMGRPPRGMSLAAALRWRSAR